MNASEVRVLRGVVAVLWLVTAALSFGLYPVERSLELLQGLNLSDDGKRVVLYAGALLDLVLGVASLLWPGRLLWLFQLVVVSVYSLLATLLVPALWLHPFGPLLKNGPVLAVLWLLYRHDQERKLAA